MPESFIPVWMSLGEATEFRRFLQEEARSTEGEFPEREFELIDSALRDEKPRSFEQMEAEKPAEPPVEESSGDGTTRFSRGDDEGWPEMATAMRVVGVEVGPFWYSGDRCPPATPGAEIETRRYVRIDLDKLAKVEDELAALSSEPQSGEPGDHAGD
jgi:hypothetical protein